MSIIWKGLQNVEDEIPLSIAQYFIHIYLFLISTII